MHKQPIYETPERQYQRETKDCLKGPIVSQEHRLGCARVPPSLSSRSLRRQNALSLAMNLFALAAVGCGASGGGTAVPLDRAGSAASRPSGTERPVEVAQQIVIENFTFDPSTLTIPAGTKVTWVNHDDVPHTATSTAKPKQFASGTLDTDDTFSHVFTVPGTYEYFCAVHPKMTGRIIVK